jgi:hypothetical protein
VVSRKFLDEQFIAAGVEIRPAARGMSWAFNETSGSVELFDDSVAGLMQYLGCWRTLQEHFSIIESGVGSQASGMIEEAISELLRCGLLTSRTEFLDRLRCDKPPAAYPSIEVLSWCTKDRPAQLARSMESFLDNAKRHGHAPQVFVCDDSHDRAVQEKNRATVGKAGKARGLTTRYLGLTERHELAEELLSRNKDIPPEVLEFALFGVPGFPDTTGANHNALLLAARGQVVFNTDDDTLCEFASRHGGGAQAFALSSSPDPTVSSFFLDAASLSEGVALEDQDILSAHASFLGSIDSNRFSAALDIDSMSAQFVHRLMSRTCRVAVVSCGVCGDCGLWNPRYLLRLTSGSRDNLIQSEATYRAATTNRLLLRAVPRPTVSDSTYFQAMCVTFDDSRLLPPFFPITHSFDGVFAQTLRTVLPDLFIAHLPLAVKHEPPTPRQFEPGSIRRIPFRLTELMNIVLADCAEHVRHASGVDALEAAGRHLEDVASLASRDYIEYIKSRYLAHISRYVADLEILLAVHKALPKYWAEDVEGQLDTLVKLPTSRDFCIPSDLKEGMSNEEAITFARQLTDRFGELFLTWPEMLEAAAHIR